MAYKKRVLQANIHYHVMNHAIRKEPLFKRTEDYQYFMQLIENARAKHNFSLCSYCLMKNHYHLHIHSPDNSIPNIMEYINKFYARYFNNKYNYKGRVFQGRYTCLPVKNDRGKLNLTRYIHFNPVEINLVSNATQYPWSSAAYYSPNYIEPLPTYMDLAPVLNRFQGSEASKKQQFIDWCNM